MLPAVSTSGVLPVLPGTSGLRGRWRAGKATGKDEDGDHCNDHDDHEDMTCHTCVDDDNVNDLIVAPMCCPGVCEDVLGVTRTALTSVRFATPAAITAEVVPAETPSGVGKIELAETPSGFGQIELAETPSDFGQIELVSDKANCTVEAIEAETIEDVNVDIDTDIDIDSSQSTVPSVAKMTTAARRSKLSRFRTGRQRGRRAL